jgi:hypothetical protein
MIAMVSFILLISTQECSQTLVRFSKSVLQMHCDVLFSLP